MLPVRLRFAPSLFFQKIVSGLASRAPATTPTMSDTVPLDFHSWRREYVNGQSKYLLEEHIVHNPTKLFDQWFRNVAAQRDLMFEEVNAVALSTCCDNRPSTRMVLLKSYCPEGFVFYTNYTSRKGRELEQNPNACMLFFWPKVHRQIRIEGRVEKAPVEWAEKYWSSRPLAARIGSKASDQSRPVESREVLEARKADLEKLAEEEGEEAVTKPESWGGYILKPDYYEFWQGQSNRLHDRIVFSRSADEEGVREVEDGWYMKRICP
uniref:Pyridoxine-5'-phosphate oxidase n=1 Tax=Steinernema glaseri TaxID=37863 RepID=A0A1I8AEX6_9BILA